MKDTRSGLFTSSIAVREFQVATREVSGFYDPTEQLWCDEGKVVVEGWQ